LCCKKHRENERRTKKLAEVTKIFCKMRHSAKQASKQLRTNNHTYNILSYSALKLLSFFMSTCCGFFLSSPLRVRKQKEPELGHEVEIFACPTFALFERKKNKCHTSK